MKILNLSLSIIFLFTINVKSQQLSVQTGHSATILDLEYSPDGNLLVSSGMDNKIIIWDLRLSKQMNILSGHNGPVSSITFHPSKNIIASASDDKTVKLWEYPSGKLIATYDFFKQKVKSVHFKPDGSELACASDSIYLINLEEKTHKTIKKRARKLFYSVRYNHSGGKIIFGGKKEFKMYVYNTVKGKIIRRLRSKSNDIVIGKKDNFLYSASNNGNIVRIPIGKFLARKKFNLSAERRWYSFFAVAITDKLLFGGNKNGLIYVFNRKNGKRKKIYKAHKGQVKALCVDNKEKFLASAGDDKRIIIWDIKNKKIVKILEGGTGSINSLSFSNNGKKMFIAYDNTDFRIWDLEKKGNIVHGTCPKLSFNQRKTRKNYYVKNTTQYINNDNILIKTKLKKSDKRTDNFLSSTDNLLIFNSKSDKEPILLKTKKNTDYQSFLIVDSTTILVFKNKSTHSQKHSLLNWEKIRDREEVFFTKAYIYNIKNKTKNSKIKIKPSHKKQSFKITGDVYLKKISEDGKTLLVLIKKRKGKSSCELFDIYSKQKVQIYDFETTLQSAGLSTKKNYAYFVSSLKDSIYIHNNTDTDKSLINSFYGKGPVVFSADERFCIYTDKEKFLHLYDLKENKEIYNVYSNHLTNISSIKINSNYNYIATAGHDGIVKFWSFDTGENLVSLAAFNESDYVYVTKDNYYYSTMGAMDYINFRLNKRLYSFEQFDVKYNRPDIVLSKLPYSTKAEVKAYNKAYLKRINKMGFSINIEENKFNIPEVSIENIDDFKITTKEKTLFLKIKAIDSMFTLNRVNMWVNDIPVFGVNGKDISNLKTPEYTGGQSITLSPGKNKIQVSATNSIGYESLKETFYIEYDTKKKKPDLYLISIGVSKYKASEYNLKYAAKDATDLSKMFKTNKRYYKKIHTVEILDTKATKNNIAKAKDLLKKSTINDIVVVFFAGHGLLNSDMDYYLATSDIEFYYPSDKGLKYEMLEDLLNDIPARKKILLIDACHSGEVDKDESSADIYDDDDDDDNNVTTDTERGSDQKILSQTSFELMKNMFADIRKGTGSTIISSAGGSEYAYESDKTKNGIFTYILIEGITTKKADLNKDGKIMVSELKDYLMKQVSKLTKGHQNPTCRRQNLEFDFKIW